ncbi:DUF3560 domain-containing protein [Deinococcus aquiradiocola]|uniref:DUF3560 domain-containing protein n=1 Tax=Deinococcus aquiradiocola TaxID=393059 RepID=A0A917UL59_9DEIO|nr:DUF3560 domain-containing protein [Deinococcus aquiradiocola]GGJ65503.1 hypothetical protein GCM10008939_06830 [Deinococcus aquiradiocola]
MTRPEPLGTATYHLDDNTLRWTPGARLDPTEYTHVTTAGFRYWRSLDAFVATWTPEREDTLLTYVDVIEHDTDLDDPTGRTERFTSRAAAAERRADNRRETATAITGQIPPGQPILVGHSSEGRHRRALARSDQHMRKALEEHRKAEYWQNRARGSERRARQKTDPGVTQRRIRTLETDLRRIERNLTQYQDLDHLNEAQQAGRTRAERWAAHLTLRLTYEHARLDTLTGGTPTLTAQDFTAGETVLCRGTRSEVIRVGTKKVRVKILDGGAAGMTLLEPPERLQKLPAPT